MKVWQALVTLTAAGEGMDGDELTKQLPRLRTRAQKALREIGTTRKEMNSEFPDRALYEGLVLIKTDPDEFRRQAIFAMEQIIGNN